MLSVGLGRDKANRIKCLTVMIFRSGLIPRSVRLDPALLGIRRTISSSRNRRSGPIELQRGRERLVGGHITPAGRDLNVTSL
jgi:hypothetical protein